MFSEIFRGHQWVFQNGLFRSETTKHSSTKKEHQPKLLSPDIFLWARSLPHEGVGGQKVRYVPQYQGNLKLFGRDIPGFCWDILAVPEKFEKKS